MSASAAEKEKRAQATFFSRTLAPWSAPCSAIENPARMLRGPVDK